MLSKSSPSRTFTLVLLFICNLIVLAYLILRILTFTRISTNLRSSNKARILGLSLEHPLFLSPSRGRPGFKLVLVLLLIGWKSGARFLNQSSSIVICVHFFFCISTLSDWLKKLASFSQPIRSKTKTNHKSSPETKAKRDLLPQVSPANRFKFSLYNGCSASFVIGQSNI